MSLLNKYDRVLILFILFLGVYIWFFSIKTFTQDEINPVVRVNVDGNIYLEESLYTNAEYLINTDNGTNILLVQDGVAKIIEANCNDKLCVNQKGITQTNETIVCLPYRVVVEIVNGQKSEVDTMLS